MSRRTGKPIIKAPSGEVRSVPQVVRLLSGLALALAIGIGVGLEIASPSSSEAAVASIRQEEARRDVTQIGELTTMARNTREAIKPVAVGLAATVPATADQIAAWQQVIRQETQRYAVTVSGMTSTNVARGAFRSAVDQLSAALDSYVMARSLPAEKQQSLLDIAGRQRVLAVTTWSIAATQLDQLNVDAGHGHQHVYLTDRPDGGAMTSDGTPEGKR